MGKAIKFKVEPSHITGNVKVKMPKADLCWQPAERWIHLDYSIKLDIHLGLRLCGSSKKKSLTLLPRKLSRKEGGASWPSVLTGYKVDENSKSVAFIKSVLKTNVVLVCL